MTSKSNKQLVLEMLSDGMIHFSAEFRDRLMLLEYRKRISELRVEGHHIKSMKIEDPSTGFKRPAYQMEVFKTDLFGYERAA